MLVYIERCWPVFQLATFFSITFHPTALLPGPFLGRMFCGFWKSPIGTSSKYVLETSKPWNIPSKKCLWWQCHFDCICINILFQAMEIEGRTSLKKNVAFLHGIPAYSQRSVMETPPPFLPIFQITLYLSKMAFSEMTSSLWALGVGEQK